MITWRCKSGRPLSVRVIELAFSMSSQRNKGSGDSSVASKIMERGKNSAAFQRKRTTDVC
jgi:hypothetical protein